MRGLVEEVIEDHLLEVAFWDGLYDVNPGNPPTRLYDKDVSAVRLSTGLKPLLARVRPRVHEVPAILASFGGSVRNRVRRAVALSGQVSRDETLLLETLGDGSRPIRDVLDDAIRRGVPAGSAAGSLASLVRSHAVALERVAAEVSVAEDRAEAQKIEGSFELFVNRLLARSHLARIYERIEEKDKAAEQYRGIADEHLARNNVDDGLSALRHVLELAPQDLEVRELVVKVLQGANRLGEAAREAVDLGRLLITVGLPGRARNAFELALKLVPGSMSVLWMLGGLLGALGYTQDAVRVYEEIAERSKTAGDEPAAIAALQQILAIDPRNSKALAALHRYSGYARALVVRYATAGIALAVLAVILAFGSYEIFALDAWKKVRDETIWPAVDARKFDIAREAAEGHARRWELSWTSTLARRLKTRIDEEADAAREQAFARDVRAARELDKAGKVPQAFEVWQRVRETQNPERKKLVETAIALDEERLKRANAGLAEARKLLEAKVVERAHGMFVETIGQAPWLLGDPAVKIPCRIDSVPRGARVWVGAASYPDPTPLVIEKTSTAASIRFDVRGRESWTQTLEALPPWPFLAFLPLRPIWRTSAVAASSRPCLARDVVVAAGTDRLVSAVSRADGKVLWSRSLGVFGESELSPTLVGADLIAVRTVSGEVVALELATGAVRWRRAVALPPLDADPWTASPVGAPAGVVVREGARGLVLLGARDGATVWTAQTRTDPLGAPAVSGELVALACGRSIEGFALADGKARWAPRLGGLTITAVAPVGAAGFAVALEPDDVARIDKVGNVAWTSRGVTGSRPSATLSGDAQTTLVGTSSGEIVALDVQGKPAWRARTGFERPLRWVREVDADYLLGGDEAALYAFDGKGQVLWQHPCAGATPAVADETRVYQGGTRGLEAFER